jgi:drug/metabolite transporter (DMT)-like permease
LPSLARTRTAFARLPAASRGALFMIGASAGFSVMMALVRDLSPDIHPFVSAFFRNLFGLLFMIPWVIGEGRRHHLHSQRWGMHFLRSMMGLAAMLLLFLSLGLMPLAEATALTFTAPLFATIGAALILGETVRLRRWTAVAVGFAGALIILRPGMGTLQPAALVALAAAAFIAGAMLTIKSLSRTEHPNAIVVIMGLMMTPASLGPAVAVWTMPDPLELAKLLAMGLAATVGQVCLTRSFRSADASVVLPFDFARLVFVAILGYLMFGEAPDPWTWTGGAVIVGATVYIAHREARTGRAVVLPRLSDEER